MRELGTTGCWILARSFLAFSMRLIFRCLRHELTSSQSIRLVTEVLRHHLAHSCSENVHLLRHQPHRPAGVPGDKLPEVLRQRGPLVIAAHLVHLSGDFKHVRRPTRSDKLVVLLLHVVNCAFFIFAKFIISFTVRPAGSPETITALVLSCWYIVIRMALNPFVYCSPDSWPEILLPPCM
jgi:hypothetical protein